MTIKYKCTNGEIMAADLTAPLPDRADREFWKIQGTTIVVDTDAKVAAVTAGDIDLEAERRIAGIIPKSDQDRMLAEAISLLATLGTKDNWPADKQAEFDAGMAKFSQTQAIRARAEALKSNPVADFKDERRWS